MCLCVSWCVPVLQIDGNCVREPLQAAQLEEPLGSTRHMWQQQRQLSTSNLLTESGSCNRPPVLRPATDSNVAGAQAAAAGTPAVTLGNYVYQCAAKREPSPSKPINKPSRPLAISQETLPWHQQMTVPAIVLQLARNWRRP